MKKQSKKSRLDESLGVRRGKESSKKESYKSRRDESKGMKHADEKQDQSLFKKMMKKAIKRVK